MPKLSTGPIEISETPSTENTTIVVVTYNNRYPLIQRLISTLVGQGFRRMVVVDNNAQNEVKRDWRSAFHGIQIEHLVLGENRGTAEAFEKGMQLAVQSGTTFLWLLDDDNLPSPDCFGLLSRTFYSASQEKTTVLAAAPSRKGFSPKGKFFPQKKYSKFINLDLFSFAASTTEERGITCLLNAPYGGLLMHRSTIERYGLPNTDYVVYVDDIEFTSRISKGGNHIHFVSEAILEDVLSQGISKQPAAGFKGADLANSLRYYALRNQAYFDRKHFDNRLAFECNRIAYIALNSVAYLLRARKAPWSVFRDAMRDAESGQLGRNEKYPI